MNLFIPNFGNVLFPMFYAKITSIFIELTATKLSLENSWKIMAYTFNKFVSKNQTLHLNKNTIYCTFKKTHTQISSINMLVFFLYLCLSFFIIELVKRQHLDVNQTIGAFDPTSSFFPFFCYPDNKVNSKCNRCFCPVCMWQSIISLAHNKLV